jgi:hypothetical protein
LASAVNCSSGGAAEAKHQPFGVIKRQVAMAVG